MSPIALSAPAKINLCLFLGSEREDHRHELVTLFEPVNLADRLTVTAAPPGSPDQVLCAGVPGPNLAGAALAALRAAGWPAPPLRVEIVKRIPVAAGMGGGSADAGALLRAAPGWGSISPAALREIAANLGADVPSQLAPGPLLGTGAGDRLAPVAAPGEHAVLVVPPSLGLPTVEVYREADRLGLPRPAGELARLRSALEDNCASPGWALPAALAVNDLEVAALSLRPEIESVLTAAREAGAESALVCGSGPTVIGLFWGGGALARAAAAASALRARFPGASAVTPWRAGVGGPAANR